MAKVYKIYKALVFAFNAHKGQERKYTREPYILHPIRVMEILEDNYPFGAPEEVLAAALLHDVVEDTEVTIENIVEEFGREVGRLVEGLTDISKPEDGNRAARKKIDREHTWAGCAYIQDIKAADVIDNCRDICTHDAKFAKVYLEEMELLLKGI